MNWKKGDIAICVKVGSINNNNIGNEPPLRLNAEYMVQNVRTCECGDVCLDVGIATKTGTLCVCGAISSPKTGIWWCNSIRFVKKNNNSIEEQLEEAIANENYELASQLKKQIDGK